MNKYSHEFSMEEADNKLLEINKKVLKILLECHNDDPKTEGSIKLLGVPHFAFL